MEPKLRAEQLAVYGESQQVLQSGGLLLMIGPPLFLALFYDTLAVWQLAAALAICALIVGLWVIDSVKHPRGFIQRPSARVAFDNQRARIVLVGAVMVLALIVIIGLPFIEVLTDARTLVVLLAAAGFWRIWHDLRILNTPLRMGWTLWLLGPPLGALIWVALRSSVHSTLWLLPAGILHYQLIMAAMITMRYSRKIIRAELVGDSASLPDQLQRLIMQVVEQHGICDLTFLQGLTGCDAPTILAVVEHLQTEGQLIVDRRWRVALPTSGYQTLIGAARSR